LIFYLILTSSLFLNINYLTNQETQKMGLIITGDFDGDGKTEKAKLVKVKSGYGNPIEDDVSDEYEIQFSNKKMKPIKIGCCEATLINEGDLNNNDKDAISIFQAPMNGCIYSMQTYIYNNK